MPRSSRRKSVFITGDSNRSIKARYVNPYSSPYRFQFDCNFDCLFDLSRLCASLPRDLSRLCASLPRDLSRLCASLPRSGAEISRDKGRQPRHENVSGLFRRDIPTSSIPTLECRFVRPSQMERPERVPCTGLPPLVDRWSHDCVLTNEVPEGNGSVFMVFTLWHCVTRGMRGILADDTVYFVCCLRSREAPTKSVN